MTRPFLAASVLIASVVLANVLTTRYGFVPAGFGLVVTAGTYTAALALVARDYLHDFAGPRAVLPVIAAGGALSAVLAEPRIALASAVAFVLAELADMALYSPLRRKRWRTAVVSSSALGAVVDTVLFLSLAFGAAALTVEAVGGQLLVKVLWVALPVAVVGGWVRSRNALPQRQPRSGSPVAQHSGDALPPR